MAIYTKGGLKIRFDENAIKPVIMPLIESDQFEDILLDMELWINLPNAVSSVSAILAAYLTKHWFTTLLVGVISYIVSAIFQELYYSDFLKRIFPLFLGSWMIAIPLTIFCGIYLGIHGNYLTIVVLTLIVLGNWSNHSDFLLIILSPFRIWLMKSLKKRFGIRYAFTITERLFILLCNKRAKKIGVELNWNAYDEAMKIM